MGHVDGIAQRWQDELLEMDPRCAAFLCPISKLLMRDPTRSRPMMAIRTSDKASRAGSRIARRKTARR